MNRKRNRRGLFFPLLLVGLGVFLLLINMGVVPGTTRENLLLYWPVILILAGLDGLWREDGLVWPLVLLGLGGLLLLGNLGYLSVRALPLLSRIWPILLVAIGIDIAFGRNRGGWQTVARAGLGIIVVGLIFWLAIAFPTAAGNREVIYSQKLDDAKTSQVELTVIGGRLLLAGGAASDHLLTGKAILPRNASLSPVYSKPVNGESQLTLGIENGGNYLMGDQSAYEYDFKMNSNLPVGLHTKVVVGDLQLDLTGTAVEQVETEMAIGAQSIIIPCNDGLKVELGQAIGDIAIYIPQGCDVNIWLENALVNTTLPAGYQRDGDIVTNSSAKPGGPSVEIRIGLAVGAVAIYEKE